MGFRRQAAALLLLVAGVPREAIVEDYTQTGKNLAGGFADALVSLITALGVPLTARLRRSRQSHRHRRSNPHWIGSRQSTAMFPATSVLGA